MSEPLIELRGVRAAYGTIEVLHGIDLAVMPGHFSAAVWAPGLDASGNSLVGTLALAEEQPEYGGRNISSAAIFEPSAFMLPLPADRVIMQFTAPSPTVTVPSVTESRPARQCISVDLPDPEGPMMAVKCPCSISMSTSLRATTRASPSPYTLVRPRAEAAVVAVVVTPQP